MRQVSGKDLRRTMARHGWTLVRVHGSHHIYGKRGSVVHLSIPVHANRPLKAGLLCHLLKQAGLDESDVR